MSRGRTDRTAVVGISAAWIGVGAIALGSLATALVYERAADFYNPLNQFVSELGEPGVSSLAPVFNLGLMVGGVGFAVFIAMLAVSLPGRLRYIWGPVGVVAGIGGVFVGIYPMDHIEQHTLAAMTFFNLGWIAVGLASIDVLRFHDARFPRWLAIVGLTTVIAFVGFLRAVSDVVPAPGEHILAAPEQRPAFWIVPVLEWAVIVGILAWTFLTGWCWFRAIRKAGDVGGAS